MVVIAEAKKKKSGSLITAEHALEQGKDIYVFPGRTTDALSYGCNALIQQGAGIILSVEEFLKQLPYNATQSLQMGKNKKQCLAKEESLVYSCLSMEPKKYRKNSGRNRAWNFCNSRNPARITGKRAGI